MFFDFDKYSYYVAPGGTDMRKGSESLAKLVIEQLKLNPMDKSMFLFCSKDKKTLAILVWDNGFWLMKKKIFSGTFVWPKNEQQAIQISLEDIKRVITGQDVWRRILVFSNDVLI